MAVTNPIEASPLTDLDVLIADAKRLPEQARQLAIDASALMATSETRLSELNKRGFFKRCWSALSGNTKAIESANVNDLAKMQNLAWQYLEALQAQQLIGQRALTVVRGNLAQLAKSHAATTNNLRTLVVSVVDMKRSIEERLQRQDATLRDHDLQLRVHSWLLRPGIKALRSLPDVLASIRLGLEYASIVGGNESAERIFDREDVEAAFGILGLDQNQSVSPNDVAKVLTSFALEHGHEKLEEILGVSITSVDTDELVDNVPGAAFAWSYAAAKVLPMLVRFASHADEGSRARLIENSIVDLLEEISTADTTLIDLAMETAAGYSLAQSIRRDVRSPGRLVEPVVVPALELDEAEGSLSLEDLLGRHVDIRFHVMAHSAVAQEGRELYVESLAVLFAKSGLNPAQDSYLGSVANLLSADLSSLVSVEPAQFAERVSLFKRHCATQAQRAAWMLDACMLAALNSSTAEHSRRAIAAMGRALGVDSDIQAQLWEDAACLATSTNKMKLLLAMGSAARHTEAWRTPLQYRQVTFRDFAGISLFPQIGSLAETKAHFNELFGKALSDPSLVKRIATQTARGVATAGLGVGLGFVAELGYALANDMPKTVGSSDELDPYSLAEFVGLEAQTFLKDASAWLRSYAPSIGAIGIEVPDVQAEAAIIGKALTGTTLSNEERLKVKLSSPMVSVVTGTDPKFRELGNAVIFAVDACEKISRWHDELPDSIALRIG